jgi:hypothetical protein
MAGQLLIAVSGNEEYAAATNRQVAVAEKIEQ